MARWIRGIAYGLVGLSRRFSNFSAGGGLKSNVKVCRPGSESKTPVSETTDRRRQGLGGSPVSLGLSGGRSELRGQINAAGIERFSD
jgi:hypothetical protein